MQKRMFRDKYGLTSLVLLGQKTQTRDIIKVKIPDTCLDFPDFDSWDIERKIAKFNSEKQSLIARPKYHIGEVVAVAQSYQKAYPNADFEMVDKWTFMTESAGWKNKMFVKPNLMPHSIKITNIRVERLQDISDEDCLAEGVEKDLADGLALYWFPVHIEGISWEEWKARSYELSRHECDGKPGTYFWDNPRQAFAKLIDKINGKGTWESNPYVWVYDFELVK